MLLNLTNAHTIIEPSFHPCVRFVPANYVPCWLTEQTPGQKTKSFFQIKNSLFCPARWPLRTDGLPLRPLREQARRGTGAHSRCTGAAPGTSTIRVSRRALRDRSRWSVPFCSLQPPTSNLTRPQPLPRRIRTHFLPARSRAGRRRSRVVPRCGRVGRYM